MYICNVLSALIKKQILKSRSTNIKCAQNNCLPPCAILEMKTPPYAI